MNVMTMYRVPMFLGIAAVLLAACGGAVPLPEPTQAPATPTEPVAVPPASPSPLPATPPAWPKEAEAAIAAARADLAGRLHVAEENVHVRKVESVTWRDSSLGCPKPGQGYLQVLTPGFRIFLEVQGQMYEYHSDTRGNIAECGEGQSPAPTEPSMGGDNPMVDIAKSDLAKRLGIPVDEIVLVKSEAVTWSDACLGIHTPGVACADVITPGYLILLSAQGNTYEYHTDQSSRALLCESGPGTCQ